MTIEVAKALAAKFAENGSTPDIKLDLDTGAIMIHEHGFIENGVKLPDICGTVTSRMIAERARTATPMADFVEKIYKNFI